MCGLPDDMKVPTLNIAEEIFIWSLYPNCEGKFTFTLFKVYVYLMSKASCWLQQNFMDPAMY